MEGLGELAHIEKDYENRYAKIPWLLDTYPYPITKTNTFLKVSQWFKKGSNNFRLALHDNVFSRCSAHYQFINDECVKRIMFVLSSNDSIARSLCLRVLGLIVEKVADNVTIHYRIREALQSKDIFELEAAVFALNQFSRISSNFRSFVLTHLLDRIDNLSCPVHIRKDLICCLEHFWMYTDYKEQILCSKWKDDCVYDSVILNVRVCLACHGVLDFGETVEILLDMVCDGDDPRSQKIAWIALDRLFSSKEFMINVNVFEQLFVAIKSCCFQSITLVAMRTWRKLINQNSVKALMTQGGCTFTFQMLDLFSCMILHRSVYIAMHASFTLADMCSMLNEAEFGSFRKVYLMIIAKAIAGRKDVKMTKGFLLCIMKVISVEKDLDVLEYLVSLEVTPAIRCLIYRCICRLFVSMKYPANSNNDIIVNRITLAITDNADDDVVLWGLKLLTRLGRDTEVYLRNSQHRPRLVYDYSIYCIRNGYFMRAAKSIHMLESLIISKQNLERWIYFISHYAKSMSQFFANITSFGQISARMRDIVENMSEALLLARELFGPNSFQFSYVEQETEFLLLLMELFEGLPCLGLTSIEVLELPLLLEKANCLVLKLNRIVQSFIGMDFSSRAILSSRYERILLVHQLLCKLVEPESVTGEKYDHRNVPEISTMIQELDYCDQGQNLSNQVCRILLKVIERDSNFRQIPKFFFNDKETAILSITSPAPGATYEIQDSCYDISIKTAGIVCGNLSSFVKNILVKVYILEPSDAVMGFDPFYHKLQLQRGDLDVMIQVVDSYFEAKINLPHHVAKIGKTIQLHFQLVDADHGCWWDNQVINIFPSDASTRKLGPQKALLTLTPRAINRLKMLSSPGSFIRIGVKNKGCSGMAYSLDYVKEKNKFDEQVQQEDSKALFTVIGSEMDYVEDKLASQFVFNNPNIDETCGCGMSFSVGKKDSNLGTGGGDGNGMK